MDYVGAARLFCQGAGLSSDMIPSVAQAMHEWFTFGYAAMEIRRWHEETGHPRSGWKHCFRCLAENKYVNGALNVNHA